MRILAIETSCDETAIALLDISGALGKPNIKVLGNTLLSQVALHEQYGGVYPDLAKREHQKNLPILLKQTLKEAKMSEAELRTIDYIAVTNGPGLEPALWTGITFATELGKSWGKPVIPVNHMEGHIYSVLYQDKFSISNSQFSKLELPALALLVSGGHTELVHIKDFGKYEILGQTRDDAVGEAFDKTARMLELPYPGGPQISRLAENSRKRTLEDTIKLPRPMIHLKNLDFSFSGLKTAVLYRIKEFSAKGGFASGEKEDMARAFEDAAIEVLVEKTRRALLELGGEAKTLIVAGGVSANLHLSRELKKLVGELHDITLSMPQRLLTTDNAIMIGIAAFIKLSREPEVLRNQIAIRADGNLSIDSERSRTISSAP